MFKISERLNACVRRTSIVTAGAASLAMLLAPPAAADDFELVPDRIYAQRQSGPLKGDLYLPARGQTRDKAVAGVVMIHGGGWRSGEIDDMERFAKRVARSGFAVFNITYRLAPQHKFPAQLEDVRDAVRWLRTHAGEYHIDPGRIGAWGYSAGAHLAMLLGTVADDALPDAGRDAPSARVSAVVAGAGPTDLREYPDNHYVADLMPADADEALFELASPLSSVDTGDAPTFLYHGKWDMIVGFHNSANMHRALVDAGVPTRLYETHLGHIFTYLFGRGSVDAGIDFLREYLQQGSSS